MVDFTEEKNKEEYKRILQKEQADLDAAATFPIDTPLNLAKQLEGKSILFLEKVLARIEAKDDGSEADAKIKEIVREYQDKARTERYGEDWRKNYSWEKIKKVRGFSSENEEIWEKEDEVSWEKKISYEVEMDGEKRMFLISEHKKNPDLIFRVLNLFQKRNACRGVFVTLTLEELWLYYDHLKNDPPAPSSCYDHPLYITLCEAIRRKTQETQE